MAKILIAEDDADINNLLREALQTAGHACVQAYSGSEGLLRAESDSFDLILLDLMLPGISGEALLEALRRTQNVPVIVVSAKDDLDSKVSLLACGADDYLTKPFAVEELLARVGAQLRRSAAQPAPVLQYKNLRLNPQQFTAHILGRAVTLTKQEFKILELLLSQPQRVFSKQNIYSYAWDDIYIGEDKTINVHISNIRKKLKAVTPEEYIETVWGIGFKLAE